MFDFSPQLTWRDIQHLTVLTSKRNSLFDAKGRFHWTMNGVGLEFNHLFGYGVLDAGAMVALAKKWKTVPPRYHCEAGSVLETQWVYFHSSTIQSQEFATQEQRNTTSSFLSFHELRITCKIENLNAYQITIGGWDRLYRSSYSIFFLSYFWRNHPLFLPFSLCVSTLNTEISFHRLFSRNSPYVQTFFFEKRINTPHQFSFFREVTSDRSILLKIKTDACAGTEYAVNYLEHVQAVISVNATRRGDLELFLTSPMGTR